MNQEVMNAKNRAVQAGRKAAKLAGQVDGITHMARQLGADIPEKKKKEEAADTSAE